MKRQPISYSQTELEFIKVRRTTARRKLHEAFVKKFDRTDVNLDNFKALCKRKGWFTGRSGCFEAGHVPDNKGKKMPFNPNSAKTQFKKGQSPHNTKHVGHEYITKDGYVKISINETNPHTGYLRRYVYKHRHLWEKENGSIPDGMCLKCLDGDKTNTCPSNWTLIPRGMLPRLNGIHGRNYDKAPAELKPTIMAVSELAHKSRERN